jgi:Leucine-rich repeat (LRR) protein
VIFFFLSRYPFCSSTGLSSTIPSEIGILTKLVFLDLDFNELTGSLPTSLYSLTDLETLELNDNFLEGDIYWIGVFSNLEFLQLQST